MSYSPTTDFLGLLRQTSGGMRTLDMPGLDFIVAGLARAGLIKLSIGLTPPIASQPTTAWFKPASPSWSAEGVLYLWNGVTAEYEVATPALWASFILPLAVGYSFQLVQSSVATIQTGATILAVQRVGPATTTLTLPNLNAQWQSGRKLQVVDFSTSVTHHVIALVTPDGSTIMQRSSWSLLSTPDQLSGIMLTPCPDLNSWIIAP